MYKCNKCNLEFDNKYSYMNHCKVHQNKVYKCECGYETINSQAYAGHRGHCKVAHPGLDFHNYKTRHWKTTKSWIRGLTKDTDPRVKKISDSLKGKSIGRGKTEELELLRRRRISESLKGRGGGYRKGSGKGKSGYYNGIWCDSSWELAYLIYCLDHNIPIERNKDRFDYEYKGSFHKYLPDFKVNNNYIEIKGRETTQDFAKYESVDNLIVLRETEMSKYLDYVTNKYGKNFISLYENKNLKSW